MGQGPNGGAGWQETDSQHTAIIESINGSVARVIEQNAGGIRRVKRGTIDFSWKLVRGSYVIYRAVRQ